ncbi:hypothetical protein EZV62_017276 [Acer yangbiense]|uniref:Annexin n=1 Tax=Acer yangbiense TaxID=1000413 RepID=A0A5C7HFQ2_9ROSI|nr:hypothetical protein EZV62_017276 [Acer yangbiense]
MSTLRVPDAVFTPNQDAEELRKAFQGFGTDEEAVIWVLGHRNASQRKKIRDAYMQLYNENLIDRLHSELSGDFRNAVVLWTYDPAERDAKLANEVLKKKRKDLKHLQVIIEIACASSPYHLVAMREAYCSLFNCSLEEDIVSEIPFPERKILLGLVSSFRYDKEMVYMDVANSEAAKLHEAIKAKQLDHDQVVYILGTRNFHQLRETFRCYERNYGIPIKQDIKNCGDADLENLLKKVISCIDTPEKHFAEVIRNSIVGLGTDEDSLTRAIVTRAEVDLKKVREEYSSMYKDDLDKDVIGDTSGYYKDFLLTLLGSKF